MTSKGLDLHESFIETLQNKASKKTDLANNIADILHIEREAAYRRLTGKVNFSLREAGIVSKELGISLDGLLREDGDHLWMPFMVEHPMKLRSMDELLDSLDLQIKGIDYIAGDCDAPVEMGNIYNTIPLEFYLYSPVLTKFMLFRWGYYFLATEELNNYSAWELPAKVEGMLPRLKESLNLDRNYYIWDEAIIWILSKEIVNMCRMNIMTEDEKKEIKNALKDMLGKLEQTLNGNYIPTIGVADEAEFYVCPIHLGFTSIYLQSADRHFITFQTNFSYSVVDNRYGDPIFQRLKAWVDSFRNISTRLSRGGRMERRFFFADQHDILDHML